MTTELVGIGSALAMLAVTLAVILFSRRGRERGEDQLARALSTLDMRFEAILRELADARLEQRAEPPREERRRTRVLGEIAGTIDFDEVLSRILEAAGALPGVDAALVRVTGDDEPAVATVGMVTDEVDAVTASAAPASGRAPRAISVAYDYGTSASRESSGSIRAAIGVPISGEGGTLGVLTIFSRSPSRTFGEDDVRELEELALRAGPAIENARQFRQARQLADLDALTGLHNRRYFHETLAREVARAHRYSRNLALMVIDLDDFKSVNDRIGHLAGDAVLAEASERVRAVVRSADIACRIGGDEFAIILPESGLAEADQLFRRLTAAVSEKSFGSAGSLRLSAGVADLRVDDDAVVFFERADEALYTAKEEGKGKLVAATAPGL